MGCWGPGLYQDDEAQDLKNSIALLAKLPVDGDGLLRVLLANRSEPTDFHQDGAPAFWLVVADQFERRGIANREVFERALQAINEGHDLRDQQAREMSAKDLKKRASVLLELKDRLTAPRPLRARPKAAKPPRCAVKAGEVYGFPTMNGHGINPWGADPLYSLNGELFKPNGWGALLILATGRAYDWFPWCAYASLSVQPSAEPTLEAARAARLLIDDSARLGVPQPRHFRRIGARLLGTLPLEGSTVQAKVSTRPQGLGPEVAVYAGWSVYGVSSLTPFHKGIAVAELLGSAAV